MKGQDELFELIKSLTPSEKRYFKVNASKGGDAKSNYLQLFEAIDAQGEEYDEDKLKKKHAKKSFVKYLSAEKKQLREQLMKQMRAYRADSTIDNRINDLLQDEAFYRDKGLQTLREKALQKAKELATKYERFHLLQEILFKQILYVEEFESKSLSEPVLELLSELEVLSIQQRTFVDLWSMNQKIFSAYRSGVDIKNENIKNELELLIARVKKLESKTENTFRLGRAYNQAHSNYYNLIGEREDSYQYSLSMYNQYQEHSHFKSEEAYNYKLCLANLIAREQLIGKVDDFLKHISELKSLPITSFNEEGEVFQNVLFIEHLHHINTGKFELAEKLVPEIEQGLKKYSNKINRARVLTFQYNIMIMYFILHKFKEAKKWADFIIEDKSKIKQDVKTITKVLYPIIHFEMNHFDIVEPLTRSAYRDLKGKSRIHEFERLLLKYFNKMPFSRDQNEFNSKLQSFSEDLKQLSEKESTKYYHGFEEISIWVSSKLKKVPMTQLLS